MKEIISFLNNNVNNISQFEGNKRYIIVHMKNGDTIEFYNNGEDGIESHHYKD